MKTPTRATGLHHTSAPALPPTGDVPPQRRPARTSVRHGQASCADYGCPLPACREAARRARRRRNQDRAAGLPSRVDPKPAAGHAAVLRRRGMAAQDIADASGISVTMIRRLLRPADLLPVPIARTTAEAVLGVALPTRHQSVRSPGRGLIGAAPAAAVLRELALAGWPATYLAAHLHTSTQTIAAVRDGERRRLSIPLDQRIHHLHSRLATTTPHTEGIRAADATRTRAWMLRRHPAGPNISNDGGRAPGLWPEPGIRRQ
ncbi:hypothetical protein [Kitasatospora arboriphila]|uniref:XRE family transcriptional regulator n=1 Tax=Kitasatospora arboriphila TaxID=258052 RepID=A0ABN1U1Q1_9ACTN